MKLDEVRDQNPSLMIYGHGGGGLRNSDKKRIQIFKNLGFDTISFDAFKANNIQDHRWANRNLSNFAKQDLVMQIMDGAIDYASKPESSYQNIILFGQSNGARASIVSAKKFERNKRVRVVLSEGTAGVGHDLPEDIKIPVVIFYGEKDNWGGEGEEDYIWTTGLGGGATVEEWFKDQKDKGANVQMIFYPNAGHSLHGGKGLTAITRTMRSGRTTTGYLGADGRAIEAYEKDLREIVLRFSRGKR
jgi:dienelactone hydrolase